LSFVCVPFVLDPIAAVGSPTVDDPDPLQGAVNLNDLEALACERLERPAFDYYAGGSGDEWTLAENRRAFERWVLRPRYLVDVSSVSTETTVLRQTMPLPVVLAPTALHRLAHPEGEVATARGAASIGVTMCISTSTSMPIESIAATGVSRWFQLHVHTNHEIAEETVRMAVAAGCSAIVLTIDTPVLGSRERDVRNDMKGWFPKDVRMENFVRASAGAHPGAELFDPDTLFIDPALTWSGSWSGSNIGMDTRLCAWSRLSTGTSSLTGALAPAALNGSSIPVPCIRAGMSQSAR